MNEQAGLAAATATPAVLTLQTYRVLSVECGASGPIMKVENIQSQARSQPHSSPGAC